MKPSGGLVYRVGMPSAGPTVDPRFPHLFTPLTIGPVTIRNRIVSSGHDTVMAVDGKVTDRLVAYQEARAQGGVGLIVAQVAGVHVSAKYTSTVLMADDDSMPVPVGPDRVGAADGLV